MQSFALSKEIQKRYGDIVEVIDYELLSKAKMYQFGLKKFIQNGFDYRTMYKRFRDDLCLLPLSPKTIISNDYNEVYDYINSRYDLVIVGSDAVWAYNRHLGLKNPYWLGPQIKCKKMSYAASAYSLDVKNVPEEDKRYIADCLKDYEYIGVRDQETFNFVKTTNSSLEVHRNCDPTVLLPTPDINMAKSILSRLGVDVSKKIVSFMISGNKYVDKIQKELGKDYEYVMLLSRNQPADRFKHRNEHYLCQLSPYEWYTVFSAFYMNITKYFHGTLLALKSNTPTVSFDVTQMSYQYMSKIRQALTDMKLEQFWLESKKCSFDEVMSDIRYIIENHDEVQQRIRIGMEAERAKSNSFFEKLDQMIKG
jgi:hypothetical protein